MSARSAHDANAKPRQVLPRQSRSLGSWTTSFAQKSVIDEPTADFGRACRVEFARANNLFASMTSPREGATIARASRLCRRFGAVLAEPFPSLRVGRDRREKSYILTLTFPRSYARRLSSVDHGHNLDGRQKKTRADPVGKLTT